MFNFASVRLISLTKELRILIYSYLTSTRWLRHSISPHTPSPTLLHPPLLFFPFISISRPSSTSNSTPSFLISLPSSISNSTLSFLIPRPSSISNSTLSFLISLPSSISIMLLFPSFSSSYLSHSFLFRFLLSTNPPSI